MNVSNVPVLPITKSISQCPGYPGNASASELEIGNIGTGNISTMATLNGRCWDGWNIIREIQWPVASGQWPVITDNVWGLDIDGTLQGAGGVGGLLAVVRSDCAATNSSLFTLHSSLYFPTYDANGNISEYVTTNGEIVAHYDYSPFGETLMQQGDLASTFTHRFSTKPWCPVTGLCEYQMRKYRPEIGRWLSRDSIEEEGGKNLYANVNNSPACTFDVQGNYPSLPPPFVPPDGLYLQTVLGPTTKAFGGFLWYIKWLLQPAPVGRRIVVQHITSTLEVSDCENKPLSDAQIANKCHGHLQSLFTSYWEVIGFFSSGNNFSEFAKRAGYDDRWSFSGCSRCTKGKFVLHGVAKLYAMDRIPAVFRIPTIPRPPSGIAPISFNDPNLSGEIFTYSRTLISEWDGCTGTGETTLTKTLQ